MFSIWPFNVPLSRQRGCSGSQGVGTLKGTARTNCKENRESGGCNQISPPCSVPVPLPAQHCIFGIA